VGIPSKSNSKEPYQVRPRLDALSNHGLPRETQVVVSFVALP